MRSAEEVRRLSTPQTYQVVLTVLKPVERKYLAFEFPSSVFHGERLIVGRHEIALTMAPALLFLLFSWAEQSDKVRVKLRVGWTERVLRAITNQARV